MEGIQPVDREREQAFVFRPKAAPADASAAPAPAPPTPRAVIDRLPISSRLRADIVGALKRASLERQLQGVEPSSLQQMMEDALEPWLKRNGYL